MTCREKRGRDCQPMYGENMIQDQRAKVVVTWAFHGKGKWLYRQLVNNKKRELIICATLTLVVDYFP